MAAYVDVGYWDAGYGDAEPGPSTLYVAAGYWTAGYAQGETSASTAGGGYDDDKPTRKRRYIRKVGDKLVITTDASAALASADEGRPAEEPVQPVQSVQPVQLEQPPEQEISLAEIRAVAAQYQQQAKVLEMFRQRDWGEMVALYEALKRQQDEDDIEMLLLSL